MLLQRVLDDENFAIPYWESMKHNVSQLFVLKSFLV